MGPPVRTFLPRCACLILLTAVSVALCSGKNGRDFAGTFQIQNSVELGGMVQATLLLRVFNYSALDVHEATLTLVDSVHPHGALGSMAGVSIPPRRNTQLKAEFTVPEREFQKWRNGSAPRLVLELPDAKGVKVRRPVELILGPTE